ncbi:hypothetical protein [Natrinema marinum]|uniref:hypothetical protein n=1 Tax=Natrinema marinum TaxID=2961598 RepID=UPI0020C8F4C2|nr:hypothetical protein [Natrinema marinum]
MTASHEDRLDCVGSACRLPDGNLQCVAELPSDVDDCGTIETLQGGVSRPRGGRPANPSNRRPNRRRDARISPATFSQHLRAGQRKIMETLLGEEEDDER